MKKLIIFISFFFLLWWVNQSFSDSWGTSTTWNNNNVECPSETRHWVLHHWVPNSNQNNALTSWTLNCTTHTYYTSWDHIVAVVYNNWWITACPSWERAVSYNGTNQMTCRRFDDTPPTISDISNTVNTNLLATNNDLYSFSVWINWWSPIISISWVRERYNNENIDLPFSCSSSPCNVSWDIRNVDNFRLVDWWREYTFRITQICDEAWNCWNWVQNYNHNVYANSIALVNDATFTSAQKNIVTNQLTWTNVADWTSKNLTIRLRDKFWNIIIPASWISRTIDFNFNVTNTMFLNQHSRNWAGSVYVNRTTQPTNFLNTRLPWWATSLNSETSTTWDYTYTFKVYTPTSNQDNTYWQVSDIDAIFNINNLTFDINWTIWAQLAQSLNSWSAINTKFNPLYYTDLTWEIRENWFIEWATQDSNISIFKNISSTVTTLNNRLQLSYSWTDSSKFNLYWWTNTSNASNIWWTNITTRSNIQSTIPTFPSMSNNFYTRLIQKPWVVWNSSNINLATHITYDITHPNWVWTISPVYNSFVLWKDSYHWNENWWEANQSWLKVLWQVSTSSNNAITENQFSSDVYIVWAINKFFSKTQMVKNWYTFARNVTWDTTNGSTITNINTHSNINNVIYFWAESWHSNKIYNLWNIGSNININTNKTILVIGWNLYIRSNLYYTGTGMLWIMVLKDRDWNWWNVYIDPSVTNIVGTIFAEKSVLWYDGIELDGSTNADILKNQLHIYGSLFSENSIGWSRESTPKCPYYITSGCTLEVAQKYDLNYLRRYYLIQDGVFKKPSNNAKVIWWWIYSSNWNLTWWNASFARNITNTSNIYAPYSVLVEYNSKVQTSPPPLFTIDK